MGAVFRFMVMEKRLQGGNVIHDGRDIGLGGDGIGGEKRLGRGWEGGGKGGRGRGWVSIAEEGGWVGIYFF